MNPLKRLFGGWSKHTETVERTVPMKKAVITFTDGETIDVEYTHKDERGPWLTLKKAVDSRGYVSLTQGPSITIYTEDIITVSNENVRYIEDEILDETKTFEQEVTYQKYGGAYEPTSD